MSEPPWPVADRGSHRYAPTAGFRAGRHRLRPGGYRPRESRGRCCIRASQAADLLRLGVELQTRCRAALEAARAASYRWRCGLARASRVRCEMSSRSLSARLSIVAVMRLCMAPFRAMSCLAMCIPGRSMPGDSRRQSRGVFRRNGDIWFSRTDSVRLIGHRPGK